MANNEIMVGMEHYKHELSLSEVSTDELKPERLLSAREMTRHRGGLGSTGWQVHHRCPQLSFDLSERRRRQNHATIQDMLKWNKIKRSAKPIECQLKIHCVPMNHQGLMEVHDVAHANVEKRASQQQKVPVSIPSWNTKKINRVVRSSLAAKTSSMATCMEQLDGRSTEADDDCNVIWSLAGAELAAVFA